MAIMCPLAGLQYGQPICRGVSTPPETAGIDFYNGLRKNSQGGVQIEILKNQGIDFYSGFRKNDHGGGGVQIEILLKCRYRLL